MVRDEDDAKRSGLPRGYLSLGRQPEPVDQSLHLHDCQAADEDPVTGARGQIVVADAGSLRSARLGTSIRSTKTPAATNAPPGGSAARSGQDAADRACDD